MSTLQEKVDQRANLWEQMKTIVDTAKAEGRDLSAEESVQYDRIEADLDTLGEEITAAQEAAERQQRHEARSRDLDRVTRDPIVAVPDADADRSDEYDTAFRTYMRDGMLALTPEQRKAMQHGFVSGSEFRAQGVASGAAGGYLVPQGFRQKLQETLKFYGAMRDVSEVIETETGNALPWPTVNDTANKGAILAENTQVTEQDVTIGQTQIDAYMYTSKLVRVSLQLLQDAGFDLENWLIRKLGERIGRIQNEHFTTGTGTAQPEGVQTNATVGVTGAATGAVTVNELIDLIHSVDPAYRNGGRARFMLADATVAALRKIRDDSGGSGLGRPIWEPSIQVGSPDTLFGYPVTVNQDMPTMASAVKSILFGDFFAGYLIRDVTGVQVLRLEERYADFLQVGFLCFQRSDGQPQDAAAIRAFRNAT